MADVVWSQRAYDELVDIYVAIGLKNPAAAERIFDRVEWRARQLGRQPRMGPKRPDIRPTVRVLVEAPYLILYEIHPDRDEEAVATIEIVSVVDSRRNLTDLDQTAPT